MRGKEKCKALKEIRRQIAEKNDIEYAVSECSFQGECKGTCPKCEAELRFLERELEKKKNLGKAVCVVGISASVCTGLTACNPAENVRDFVSDIFHTGVTEETAGDIQIAPMPTEVPAEAIDGGIAPLEIMPENMEVPVEGLDGDIALPEATSFPKEIEIDSMEIPVEEILEGDVAIIEGKIMVAPEASNAPAELEEPMPSQAPLEEELLAGDIPLAPEE